MASHGTDQIIVQRLLARKINETAAARCFTSGVIVPFQFIVFF